MTSVQPSGVHRDDGLLEEELTGSVIGAFYEVYTSLGFGFLERVYGAALERELLGRHHHVAREVSVPVLYKGTELTRQRLDMIVDNKLVIEIKSMDPLPKAAKRQLFNYLRGTNLEVGLLLHFGPTPVFLRLISHNPHPKIH